MKPIRSFTILVFAIAVLTQTGCSTFNRLTNNHIRATVNSKTFNTTAITGTALAGRITMAGSTTTGSQMMTIIVPATIKPGTYKLTSTGNYLIEYKAGNNNVYAASSGELIILSHDLTLKKINGTFNFKGLNLQQGSVDVSNGNFTVSYF